LSTPTARRTREREFFPLADPSGKGTPDSDAPAVPDVPNLIAIQRSSFDQFLNEGLRDTVNDISPIQDFTGTLMVEFGPYTIGGWEPGMPFSDIMPNNPIKECREKDMTYAAPLTMEVSFVNKESGEIRRQKVFMGDLPLMTEWGTFIINGTERVIVTQLVRSPGAYLMEPKDREKQVFIANLMPARGSWVELEIDKKGLVNVRIDRKRKLPVTTLLFALGYTRDDVRNLFRHPLDKKRVNPFIENTLEKDVTEGAAAMGNGKSLQELEALAAEMLALAKDIDTVPGDERLRIEGEIERIEKRIDLRAGELMQNALIEVFKKQRPGEPPTEVNSLNLVRGLFFDPKRYDLTKVGRYKLDARLSADSTTNTRTLANPRFTGSRTGMTDDLVELIRRLVDLPIRYGIDEESKDFAADGIMLPRDEMVHELDEYEHFGNRRLRTVGELIQEAFRIGLYRMERVVRERMSTEDPDTITPQTIINIRPVVAALKEFFGSSQLSQFMDQTNSLAGLTHRRRLSALGAGGLTRERAPIEVRDVHPTHYGRMCPIETPEGPNIGLIGSLSSHATVNEFGFIQTPYRVIKGGRLAKDDSVGEWEIVWLDATQEENRVIAQASAGVDKAGRLTETEVLCRRNGQPVIVGPKDVEYMDVSPDQIVSVATALIPFLEHNDANRALMGANMQRQAVPLMVSEAPLVGTGMEHRAAVDTGDVIVTQRAGTVAAVDATRIIIEVKGGEHDEYGLEKFVRSNQGTLIHQKPIVRQGDTVEAGQVLADGSSTDQGELALGKNMLVAFMSWEGYNFEDAIIVSHRLVKDDVLSSIHIEEYEIDARTTKLGAEEITRDIPNRSEESLADLDERGVVRIGAEVTSGDLLVGKVTPKGETELTAEEKLIRAIFKEKAGEVRDTSLKVPHGEGGKVIDVKTFSREAGDDLPAGVNELVRVYVAKRRKIAEGDKLAGRHGNKGVISKIVPEEDMPFLEDGKPIDMILNPLGVPSRMNIGQILETHLGWAASTGWQKGEDGRTHRTFVATPVFNGATPGDVDRVLTEWSQAHADEPIDLRVNADEGEGRRVSGKLRLFNGRTGEPYDGRVTVGYMYMLKLLHLVDDKIHARSTGPYSLVTQQPLGGKAQFGGQRFGEMEVWALEAYGAAYTLQEMLTIKSDDTVGRVKAYEAIVKGENIQEPSIPESFKVLLKEMQSLALDVRIEGESGADTAAREDDELLRAAEELGIDLSGAPLPIEEELEKEAEEAKDAEKVAATAGGDQGNAEGDS
jgi:DNA-directed RNA polymerase subunit beta